MASPHQPDQPETALEHHPEPADLSDSPVAPDEDHPPVLRLRLAIWDVICTIAMLTALVILVTTTSWPARLFAFTDQVCPPDTCAPVPYGIDLYIYPVMWGGIGAAISAAGVGPFVSLLKGWYMSFWPVLAVAIITLTSIAGYALTAYSARYWH